MLKQGLKSFAIYCLLVIFCSQQIFAQFSFFPSENPQHTVWEITQEVTPTKIDIVAVLVDDQIYDAIQSDVQRYAQQYIQWNTNKDNNHNAVISSKALVFPINTKEIQAPDIVKILENLYFNGEKDMPSRLKGVVLIGDIPFPVVKDTTFVFPTIYPYVDFEQQKFVWDSKQQYFVPKENSNNQAEIFHGIIKYNTIQAYKKYFEKLKVYVSNPQQYIWKNFRYEDLVANKQSFLSELQSKYINNWIFAEDIAYHRYTKLFLDILQKMNSDEIADVVEWLPNIEDAGLNTQQNSQDVPTLMVSKIIKEWHLKSYQNLWSKKFLSRMRNNLQWTNRWISSYTKKSKDAEGKIQEIKKKKNTWDTHFMKVEAKDPYFLWDGEIINTFFIDLNTFLEKQIDEQIDIEKYYMHIPLPLEYLDYEKEYKRKFLKKGTVWEKYDAYKNYYFGTPAENIASLEQTSIYRWTFRNLSSLWNLKIQDIQNSNNPSTDIAFEDLDLQHKSIWASYDIFSQQVAANRGYNYLGTDKEVEVYQKNKIAKQSQRKMDCFWIRISSWCIGLRDWEPKNDDDCNLNDEEEQGKCESITNFALRNRWGASPLNLSWITEWTRKKPFKYQNAIRSIFDIAGSRGIDVAEYSANNFEAIKKYTNLIQKRFSGHGKYKFFRWKRYDREDYSPNGHAYGNIASEIKFPNQLPTGELHEDPSYSPRTPLKFSSVDFFDIFPWKSVKIQEDIIKLSNSVPVASPIPRFPPSDPNTWKIWTYKTIDTRIKNTAVTQGQIIWWKYKVFSDDISPELQNNKKLISWLWNIKDEAHTTLHGSDVSVLQQQWTNLKTGFSAKINTLHTNVSWIDGWMRHNISLTINSNTTTLPIIFSWLMINFSDEEINMLQEKITALSWSLVSMNDTIASHSFESFSDDVEDIIKTYRLNRKKYFVLDQWIEQWKNLMQQTIQEYTMDAVLQNTLSDYSTELANFSTQLDTIAQLIVNMPTEEDADTNNSENNGIVVRSRNRITIAQKNMLLAQYQKMKTLHQLLAQLYSFEEGTEMFYGFNTIASEIAEKKTELQNEYTAIKGEISQYITNEDIKVSTDEHLIAEKKGMNLSTSDRPIDSPRYITFQWVGWDLVKFIYPNLYKVEVFTWLDTSDNNANTSNQLVLKTPEQIEQAIKDYLITVVKKYNEYLVAQNQKRQHFFAEHQQAFTTLWTLDPLASPKSEEHKMTLFPEDFLIKKLEQEIKNNETFKNNIWWYTPLAFIAQMLYYQNINWKERTVGSTIQNDLIETVKDFDPNTKIIATLQEYLTRDNDKGMFLTPLYRKDWYEVAYLNSDGDDYIRSDEDNNNEDTPIHPKNTVVLDRSLELYEELGQEIEDNEWENTCWAGANGTAFLIFDFESWSSPWLEALNCWIEHLSGNVQFSIEYPMVWKGINDIPWYTLLQDDAEKELERTKKKWKLLRSEDENSKILGFVTWYDGRKLTKIHAYTQIGLGENTLTADATWSTVLSIFSSNKELGKIDFTVYATWDSCLKAKRISSHSTSSSDIQLCKKDLSFTADPQVGEEIAITLDDNNIFSDAKNKRKSGYDVIAVKMCLPNTEICINKVEKLNILPWKLTEIWFWHWGTDTTADGTKKILAWSVLPLQFFGKDKRWNSVWHLITQQYTFSVGTGKIGLEKPIASSFDCKDFSKGILRYQAPEMSVSQSPMTTTLQIKDQNGGVKAEQELVLISWKLKFKRDNQVWESTTVDKKIDYSLTSTDNGLPRITISLIDANGAVIDVDTMLPIASTNRIFKVWTTSTKNNKEIFKRLKKIPIKNGKWEIVLFPTFIAGTEKITVQIPWVWEHTFAVETSPWDASQTMIYTDTDEVNIWDNVKVTIHKLDQRGNALTDMSDVQISVQWGLSASLPDPQSLKSTDEIQFYARAKKWWKGKGKISAYISGVSPDEQTIATKRIMIKDAYLPTLIEKNLNIMYLNMFGSDRWNMRGYFSSHHDLVPQLMKHSDRLLATTTQLITPANIKWIVAELGQDSQILAEQVEAILQDGSLWYRIPWIAQLKHPITGAEKMQLKEISDSDALDALDDLDNLDNKSTAETTANMVYYIPKAIDSIITQNTVKGNKITVQIWEWIHQQASEQKENIIIDFNTGTLPVGVTIQKSSTYGRRTLFDLKYNAHILGTVVFALPDLSKWEVSPIQPYQLASVWWAWSTNSKKKIVLVDPQIAYQPNKTYESIEDSIDPKKGIGFSAKFKNITNFWEGVSVGEATIPFGSEFLINYWDPLVKRISENEALEIDHLSAEKPSEKLPYTAGVGKILQSFPDKTIQKVVVWDINNDNEKDIIVLFDDATIGVFKKYQWSDNYEDLWPLMYISDGVKDLFIWDIDANQYNDLIIHTDTNKIKVYKNTNGKFAIDGRLMCLNTNVREWEVSTYPENIEVHQLFVKDMDNDNNLDIITYDTFWYIKIFYWWSGDPLVSKEQYTCDDWWRERQKDAVHTVKKYILSLDSEEKVTDASLIRWKWLWNENTNFDDIDPNVLGMSPDTLPQSELPEWADPEQISKQVISATSMDIQKATALFQKGKRPTVSNLLGFMPQYEQDEEKYEYEYLRTWDLKDTDPVYAYKKYRLLSGWQELQAGDTVEVEITLQANAGKKFIWTFSDNIEWPRVIEKTLEGKIENFEFVTIPHNDTVGNIKEYWDLDNARYTFDAIEIPAGKTLQWKYTLTYLGSAPTVELKIEDTDGKMFAAMTPNAGEYTRDEYLDIQISPVDGCVQEKEILFNAKEEQQKYRTYDAIFVDIGKYLLEKAKAEADAAEIEKSEKLANVAGDINAKGNDINTIGGVPLANEPRSYLWYLDLSKVVQGVKDSVDSVWDTVAWWADTVDTTDGDAIAENVGDIAGEVWNAGKDTTENNLGEALNSIVANDGLDLSETINGGIQIMDSLLGSTADKMDDFMNELCAGWGWKGLPIPFNQAFLAPWKYHLFGCYDLPPVTQLLGKWVPTLFFPWTLQTPVWPIPMIGSSFVPLVSQGLPPIWTDGFWIKGILPPWGGTYSSMFRLYLVPTLTAQMGVAMCFWPYAVGKALKSPFADLWWNCIVTVIKPKWWGDEENTWGAQGQNPAIDGVLSSLKTCLRTTPPWKVFSPFRVNTTGNSDQIWWMIDLGVSPKTWGKFEQIVKGKFGNLIISWGAEQKNKVTNWKAWWFIKTLINDWLDKQIRYIINNLKFSVNIVFPNFDSLSSFSTVKENNEQFLIKRCKDLKWTWNPTRPKFPHDERCEISQEQKCINKGMIYSHEKERCVIASDPNAKGFENLVNKGYWRKKGQYKEISRNLWDAQRLMEEWFKDVPLINLRSETITINVPNITKEDIFAYTNKWNQWIKRQQQIVQERKTLFINIFSLCDKDRFNEWKDIKKKENLLWLVKMLANQEPWKPFVWTDVFMVSRLMKKYDFSKIGKNVTPVLDCDWNTVFRIDDQGTTDILPKNIYFKLTNDNTFITYNTKKKIIAWKEKNKNGKIPLLFSGSQRKRTFCTYSKRYHVDNSCKRMLADVDVVWLVEQFVKFETKVTELTDRTRQNITTLQQYQKLPRDIYRLVHVWEKYVWEVGQLLKSVVGSLWIWMKINAKRIAQYIDAITTIMTTLETYQLLIDFSVEWTEKCGTCTNDTYDQYSCKLGFLCPELPIIPVPPFKIPDINVDLSNINMGMDIKLPKFNFVSYPLPLPELPSLPTPPDFAPNINASLDLNLNFDRDLVMPLIPQPPEIPEMPSLVPKIKMKLPLVPPAPKIPKLPNKITGIIKTAKKLAKIMCIVKQPIGLVGEDAVKAKIEQLTQRQYEVPLFDNIDFTPQWLSDSLDFIEWAESQISSDAPLRWFDIDVKSYLNIQLDFDEPFAIFQWIANAINKESLRLNQKIEDSTNYVSKVSHALSNTLAKGIEITAIMERKKLIEAKQKKIEEIEKIMIEISKKIVEMSQTIDENWYEIKRQEKIYKLYDRKRKKLEQEIADLKKWRDPTHGIQTPWDTTQNTLDRISHRQNTKDMLDIKKNISSQQNTFVNLLTYEQVPYSRAEIQETKNNLTHWLTALIANEQWGVHTQKAKQLLKDLNTSPSVYASDITTLQEVTEHIIALEQSKISDLSSLIKDDYENFATTISDIQMVGADTDITLSMPIFSHKKSEHGTIKQKITPHKAWEWPEDAWDTPIKIDPSTYIRGIFVPLEDGKVVSVVKSQDYAEKNQEKYYIQDLNNDKMDDIILRDESTIYIKYAKDTKDPSKQENQSKDLQATFSSYYVYPISSHQQLEAIANTNIKIADSYFQIYTKDFEVKEFLMQGQSYEDITISRKNIAYQDQLADGYLVRYNKRIDTFFDKKDSISWWDEMHVQYALVFPDHLSYTGMKLTLWWMTKNISEYTTGEVITIGEYNLNDEKIELSIPQENAQERAWKYLEIYTLKRDSVNGQYLIHSPVSNQIVWGEEASSDSVWPEITADLYRPSTQKRSTWWSLFQWYIATHYDLNIFLKDNIMLASARVFDQSWTLLQEKKFSDAEGIITVKDLFFEEEKEQKYMVEATDMHDNLTIQEVILQIKKPWIQLKSIVDIESENNESEIIPAQIISVLDHDIDEGIVNFYRKRNTRDLLTSQKDNGKLTDHILQPLKRVIIWWTYSFSNNLGFYDTAGKKIAELNPYNGHLAILPKYVAEYYLDTVYGKQDQILKIRRKRDNKELFQVALPLEKLVALNAGGLEKIPLTSKLLWTFVWWWALKWDDNKVYLYVSPQGVIYTEYDLHGRYEFDEERQTVRYYFSYPEDGISEWYVEVKIRNFLADLRPDQEG